MSKAILIMDMPKRCGECRMFYEKLGTCELTVRLVECGYESERQEWCPLREVPQKKDLIDISHYECAKRTGYNACIDEILGGGE